MRTALVTGGARGLGAASAERLRADGIRVITLDIGGDVDVVVDITDEAAFAAASDAIGPVDIVINSAGMVERGRGRVVKFASKVSFSTGAVYDISGGRATY